MPPLNGETKVNIFIYIIVLLLFVTSCNSLDNIEQEQHDIFPLPCKKYNRAYYVDKDGMELNGLSEALNRLVPNQNFSPTFFQDGLLRVDVSTPDGRNRVFLNENGEVVLDMLKVIQSLSPKPSHWWNYAKFTDFSHGICFVETFKDNDRVYTAINKKGEKVFTLPYKPVSAFNEKGQAYCKDNDKYGIISDKGEILLTPSEEVFGGYSTMGYSSEEVPPIPDAVIIKKNGYTLCDYDGNALSATMSYPFRPDANGCCVIPMSDNGGTWGIVDKDGKVLCETNYRNLRNDGKWYWFESRDGEYGWVDKNGETVIGPLKLQESQSRYSRTDRFPHLFYGSEYSVGTNTSNDKYGLTQISGCVSIADFKKMSESPLKEYDILSYTKAQQSDIVLVSPVVNGYVIGIKNRWNKALVYKIDGEQLVPVNKENDFVPKYGESQFHIYGIYAINPNHLWQGLR